MVDRIRRKIKAGEEPTWEDILNVLEDHESALHDFARNVRWVLRFMAFVFILGVVSSVYFAYEDSKRSHDIQNERVSSILFACNEQNKRHDDTIEALDRVTLQRLASQPRIDPSIPYSIVRVQLRKDLASASSSVRLVAVQGRELTIFLIDAIVPKQDCQKRVRTLVPSGTG